MINLDPKVLFMQQNNILMFNNNKVQIKSTTNISKIDFLTWFAQSWHFLIDEGMAEAMFVKSALVEFLQEMVHCPFAMRTLKIHSADEFEAFPEDAKVRLWKRNSDIISCSICVEVEEVGDLYFLGSTLFFHDVENKLMYEAYVD